ncbi:MAG: branched-chain amino acid ABC transporter permease [Candidatus Bathyarchaeia archaeon]
MSKLGTDSMMGIIFAATIIVLALIPITFRREDLLHWMNLIFFMAALGNAWNIICGYGGQLSLGHGAFFAVGAYTSTLLWMWYGITPLFGMFVGALLALPMALMIGYPAFRLRGTYFTLGSLALGSVVYRTIVYLKPITQGNIGIPLWFTANPFYLQFPSEMGYYYVFLAALLITTYVSLRVKNSWIGYYLFAIGNDQDAAESLGVDSSKIKLYALLISALLTAILGTLYAQWKCYIDPDATCSTDFSIQIAMIGIIGGLGAPFGPIVGAAVTIAAQALSTSFFGAVRGGVYMVYGVLLMGIILIRPTGIVGVIEKILTSTRSPLRK